MEERLRVHYYKTVDMFRHDFMLIVNNCRTYNDKETNYYGCADKTERLFHQLMERLDLGPAAASSGSPPAAAAAPQPQAQPQAQQPAAQKAPPASAVPARETHSGKTLAQAQQQAGTLTRV
jgi:hypothetical protein